MMPTWEPKHNIVYKSWTKTPFFRSNERSFIVEIIINNEQLDGSFSVGNKWCEIRAGSYKLILPKENVKFSKHTETFNTIPQLGQNGGAGKITTYTAKVLSYTSKDMERFKRFKSKKRK